MTCPSCKFDNPSAARFCEQCGTALELKCPRCSATVSAGARFCGACGNQLATPEASAKEPSYSKPHETNSPPANAFVPEVPDHLAEKILSGRAALEGERRVGSSPEVCDITKLWSPAVSERLNSSL